MKQNQMMSMFEIAMDDRKHIKVAKDKNIGEVVCQWYAKVYLIKVNIHRDEL